MTARRCRLLAAAVAGLGLLSLAQADGWADGAAAGLFFLAAGFLAAFPVLERRGAFDGCRSRVHKLRLKPASEETQP